MTVKGMIKLIRREPDDYYHIKVVRGEEVLLESRTEDKITWKEMEAIENLIVESFTYSNCDMIIRVLTPAQESTRF